MSKKEKIIIDTDAGHDDMLALMLLIKSEKFDIQAITTVAGNSTIENVTRNAAHILDILKRRDIPVYSGLSNPLVRSLITANVHGESGLAGAYLSETKFSLSYNAPEKIIDIVTKNPGIRILTIGPLTNIARALNKKPKIANNIKEIVIMGGAIAVPGNKNRVGEFNMVVDPEAADIVFHSSIKKILVPLDPCNNIPLFLSDFEKLNQTPFYLELQRMMKHFIAGIAKFEGTKGALIYDALAAYYLLNPKAYKLEAMDIVIETKGEHTFGMAVVERRVSMDKDTNVQVAMRIDRGSFVKDFISILKK